jgi:hypothetical protein
MDSINLRKETRTDANSSRLVSNAGRTHKDDVKGRRPLEMAHIKPNAAAKSPSDSTNSSIEVKCIRGFRGTGKIHIRFKPVF